MNYFELYEIPVSLTPDQQQVKQKFYELSRKYHPDFYTQENDSEQAEALEMSSQVNRAFKVFIEKDETIKYVLQLKGLLEEEEKYSLPPDFLMEMMDLNEQLMDAKIEEDLDSIGRVRAAIGAVEDEIYQPVKSIVEGYREGTTTAVDMLRVKEYYFKKKYLKRILAAIQ